MLRKIKNISGISIKVNGNILHIYMKDEEEEEEINTIYILLYFKEKF